MEKMLKKDRKERITVEKLLGHPWLRKGDLNFKDSEVFNEHEIRGLKKEFIFYQETFEKQNEDDIDPIQHMITPRVCDKHGHDLEENKKRSM